MTLITKLSAAVVVVLVLSITVFSAVCPCERTPGLWLWGEEIKEPVTDWSFANTVPLCQLQVNSWRPHSINLNCMSANQELFISCMRCEGKVWSTMALNNPQAVIRMGDKLYPVTLKQLKDEALLDIAWQARAEKMSREPQSRPEHWWSFQLESL